MNIKSKQDLLNAVAPYAYIDELTESIGEAARRYGPLDEANFWQHRDFLRLNWPGAAGVLCDNKWVLLAGGEEGHFLHVASDGVRVCYTKDAEKGRDDIQTVVTADRYKELFGVNMAEYHPDRMPAKEEQAKPMQEQVIQNFNARDPVRKESVKDNTAEDIATQKEAEAFLRGAHLVLENVTEAEIVEGYDELIVKAVYKALKILDIIAKKGV